VDLEEELEQGPVVADVDASELWPGKVVTEVTPAGDFWLAEPEHQDYLERLPYGYTCHFVRPNWKLPRRVVAEEIGVEPAETIWPASTTR
jgi:peptide-methionine (S)-S-oxide reductase